MIESFVDLTYRSLPLGRRVKLTQVRPTTGYLEVAAPMPVGATISIGTDEGVTFEATVSAVHEQVGGSERQPGMLIAPAIDHDDKASSWWHARVALPELPPRATIPDLVAAGVLPTSSTRPRQTAEMPTLAGTQQHVDAPVIEALPPETVAAAAAADREAQANVDAAVRAEAEAEADGGNRMMPAVSRTGTLIDRDGPDLVATTAGAGGAPVIDDGVRTTVMQAIDDPVLIDQLPAETEPPTTDPQIEPPIIDDGKKTIVMAAVDVRALGLDPSQSGEIAVIEAGGDDEGDDSDKSDANGKKTGPNKRRRGKRR